MNSLGTHDELGSTDGRGGSSRTAAEWLWALLPIGVSVFCLSALVYYHLHHNEVAVASTLQVLIAGIYRTIGFAPSFLFFLLLLSWSSIWFVVGRIDRPMGRLARLVAMTVMLGVLLNLGDGAPAPHLRKGELGAWLAEHLVAFFGYYPSLVMVWGITFGAFMLATDYFFSEYFERLRAREEPLEVGVEAAAADHLKGLGAASERALVPPSDAAAPFAGNAPSAVPSSPSAGATQGAPVDDAEVDVEPAVDLAVEPAVYRPRRRSYFERRAAEAESPAVPARGEEPWVPTGPDAQEIENPEFGPVAGGPVAGGTVADVPSPADASPAMRSGQYLAIESAPEVLGGAEAMQAAGAAPFAAEPAEPEPAEPEPAEPEPAEPGFAEPAAVDGGELQAPIAFEEASPDDGVDEAVVVTDEPVVSIPRPEVPPVRERRERDAALPAEAEQRRERETVRQQVLFGPSLEDALVAEAVEVVTTWRRASATFLQRKLRIDYELACRVLAELARRGIVELEADASHGRVVG